MKSQEMAETERLLTAQDLAVRYSVPVSTIYAWNFYGGGPRLLKLGRHCRYRLDDVLAWEKTREKASTR